MESAKARQHATRRDSEQSAQLPVRRLETACIPGKATRVVDDSNIAPAVRVEAILECGYRAVADLERAIKDNNPYVAAGARGVIESAIANSRTLMPQLAGNDLLARRLADLIAAAEPLFAKAPVPMVPMAEAQKGLGLQALEPSVRGREVPDEGWISGPAAQATRAFVGEAQALPHASQIQRSFGRHDITTARAYVGGAAAEVAREVGGRAFAVGDRIAFETAPDLFTAAHEAAHVIQQRHGAGPSAGIDGYDDEHEAHADAVAIAVLAGRSAEPLLDAIRGGTSSQAVVQRAPARKATTPHENPALYLDQNNQPAFAAIETYLRSREFPHPHARLLLLEQNALVTALMSHLRAMQPFDGTGPLEDMLFPVRPFERLHAVLPATAKWEPVVGNVLAQMFLSAIVGSLKRLGERWVTLADQIGEPAAPYDPDVSKIRAESLIASNPLDLAVRRGLTKKDVIALVRNGKQSKKATAASQPLRSVKFEWLGREDNRLWNWVRCEPADATAEELSASMFRKAGRLNWDGDATYYAFRFKHAAPYFGIPGDIAQGFAGAREHKPASGWLYQAATPAMEVALAQSKISEDVAVGQASKHAVPIPKDGTTLAALESSRFQLDHLQQWLAKWGLAANVKVALDWVTTKQAMLASADESLRTRWLQVALQQKVHLSRIGNAIQPLVGSTITGDDDVAKQQRAAFKRILTVYSRAVASSHLAVTCERLIEDASAEQAGLTLASLQTSANALAAAARSNKLDNATSKDVAQLQSGLRVHESALIAGKSLDAAALEQTLLGSQEQTLILQLAGMRSQAQALRVHAASLPRGWADTLTASFHGAFRDVVHFAETLENDVTGIQTKWDLANAGMRDRGDDAASRAAWTTHRRQVLDEAQLGIQQLFAYQDRRYIRILNEGSKIIAKQAQIAGWVKVCGEMLALIAISMVATPVAAAAGRAAFGFLARARTIETIGVVARGARLVGSQADRISKAVTVATDAAINTAGQMAIQGADTTQFVENVLQNLGTSVVLKQFARQTDEVAAVAARSKQLFSKSTRATGFVLSKGVELTGELVVNVAMAYVAKMVVRHRVEVPPNLAQDWFMQGLAMGIGRFASKHLIDRKKELAHVAALEHFAEGRAVQKFEQRARAAIARAQVQPRGEVAVELLTTLQKFHEAEIRALEAAVADPRLMKDAARDPAALKALLTKLKDQPDYGTQLQLEHLPLHQAHLEQLVEGTESVWEGSRADIEKAVLFAETAHLPIRATRDVKQGLWHIKIASREFVVHEKLAGSVARQAENTASTRYDARRGKQLASFDAARSQQEALDAAKGGQLNDRQRKILADELKREVPELTLAQAQEQGAQTAILIVTHGTGDTGIKTLNDELTGYTDTNKVIEARDRVFARVFAAHEMRVVHSGYKANTISSKLAPAEVAKLLPKAMAEFDAAMRVELKRTFTESRNAWRQELKKMSGADAKSTRKRIDKLTAAIARLDTEPGFIFGYEVGVAPIRGGRYEDIVAARMNASKAAIMSRDRTSVRTKATDAGDPRAMVYSEAEVQKVARDAVAIRAQLQKLELPIYGRRAKVIGSDGQIHEDIARVARKNKMDRSTFKGTPADEVKQVKATGDFATYDMLQKYLKEVNTVDFVTNDRSTDAGKASKRLDHALEQLHALERRQAVDGKRIETLLTDGLPQQETAAEIKFFGRASRSRDREVLNADIRDLGLDVIEANAATMSKISRGTSIDEASRATSDTIVERKRQLAKDLQEFYRDVVLPRVTPMAQTHPEIAHVLTSELTPLFLLGGDEITISIPRSFGEAGVAELLVGFLSSKNARVAVTRSGKGDARQGHIAAMKAAENAHDVLKTIEETSRQLKHYSDSMDSASRMEAGRLRASFIGAYTDTNARGQTVVKDRSGNPIAERQFDRAQQLLKPFSGGKS